MAILSPPAPPTFSSKKDTSIVATMTDSRSGILERRFMYYDTDPYATTGVVYKTTPNTNPSSVTFTGLKPGATYECACMVRNADGWSYVSASSYFTTYKTYLPPPAPDAPVLSLVEQSSVRSTFTDNGNNGFNILERQISYGTTSTASSSVIASSNATPSVVDIKNLSPGIRYYFKSRVRNEPGWSAYSAIVYADLIAGAWVNVNGVWKKAVPYVNVAGVWKIGRPYTKIAGVWKEDL